MVRAYKPDSLREALEIVSREKCIILAGGTDLMVKKKHWPIMENEFDKIVLFLSDLKELKEIRKEKGSDKERNNDEDILNIGATCTCSQIIESKLVPDFLKGVFLNMASPAIRNIATIGGNICNSSPAGDSLPMLYAMDALLILENLDGNREIHIEDFITGPGKNVMRRDEILTQIKIPLKNFDVKVYKKVGTRRAVALSKLSFIGLSDTKESKLTDIRIAFGAVGPTVVRSRDAENEIIKMCAQSMLDIKKIRIIYEGLIKPIDDQRSTAFYRSEVCLRLIEDFLLNKVCAR